MSGSEYNSNHLEEEVNAKHLKHGQDFHADTDPQPTQGRYSWPGTHHAVNNASRRLHVESWAWLPLIGKPRCDLFISYVVGMPNS